MKDIRISNFFYFLLCILFLSVQSIFANETFQNNLLKVDVNKNASGVVKMTFYTIKPYNDSVIVNKKNDFEYVILLPETANSLTAKPSLNSTSGIVKDINVKTQQYDNQIKGYTKITISTTQPVQIDTQVQTLNTSNYRLSENDYQELLSQSKKKEVKQIPSVKKESKKSVQAPKQAAFAPAKNRFKVALTPMPKASTKIGVSKTVQKPIENTKIETPILETQTVAVQNKELEQSPEIFPTVVEPTKVENETRIVTPSQKITNNYKTILKNNFYTILGIVAFFLSLLLWAVKKTNRNHAEQKKIFMTHLEEQPLPFTDYTKNISEDMSWKEKFKTYVDTVESNPSDITPPTVETPLASQELDELFIDEDLLNEIEERNVENVFFDEDETLEIEEPFETFEKYEIEENTAEYNENEEQFYDEQLELSAEPKEEPEIETEELVKSEFVIDGAKGFYLVDFENSTALVGHIEDEIFILKRFNEKIEAQIQARLNEQKGNNVSYMTKVGDYRALVEVTPKDMNLLLEL